MEQVATQCILKTSDLVLIGTTFFLGTCALIAPYVAEIIKRKAFAPKLKILFELAPPFCHITSWGHNGPPVYYFRFKVRNEGKTQARQCEIVLEKLWVFDSSDTPQPYENFSLVNMVWVGNSSEEFININPEREFFGDIGHISSAAYQKEEMGRGNFKDIRGYNGDGLRFMLDQKRYHHSQPSCLAPEKKYIVQVALYSENAGYQKEYFHIYWSGIWQDSESEMFREIVIKHTNKPT